MDFNLTEEQLLMQKTAKEFAEKEIAPFIEEDEANHHFRMETLHKMAELGFFGCVIPEEYGGNDSGWLSCVLLSEQIAKVSASWGLPFNMQTIGPGLTILRWGTEEQKKKYLPDLVDCKKLGCFAITEPNSGSDVVSMKTTAREDGDHYVLNGNKMWISNAHIADVGIVFAHTDRSQKHKGMSAFIVDLKETEGVSSKAITAKLGLHCSPTGELYFDEARVPKENMLGKPGDGFKVCMTLLDNTRLSCASRALGVGAACLDLAMDYAAERTQFGKPLNTFQMVQADIAKMFVDHEAAKFLVYRAAWQKDQERWTRNSLEVSTAKFFAADAANHAADMALRIHGSYGFSKEYAIERFFRDAKSFQIVEGTHNIQQVIIANNLINR